MKIKTTTSIDPYLKSSFESTQSLHNKSFSEVLEAGIQQVLKDVSPLEYVQLTISQREQELSELRSKLAELEVLERQKKASKKADSEIDRGLDIYLEDFRNKRFADHVDSAVKMLRKGSEPNWKNMAPRYQFSNVNDFKKWFFGKMNEEGIVI
ncbi:hypothetical protein [Methanolobus sp. ZRKC5]|uniref:hypothetical protein n=1 Tax=unclassified Methanolobus TaxID=2629569 RepID=UPI00313D98D2